MPRSRYDFQAMSNNQRGLHFLLGTEYERKKQKLQEELQMDYKRYINQKRGLKAEDYGRSQAQGLSLPITERTSLKEKLREERSREYNLFLQEQAKTSRRGQFSVASKPEEPSSLDTYQVHIPGESYRPAEPSPPRKDVATLTDIVRSMKSRKRWDLSHQRQRDILSKPEGYSSSEESKDSGEEIELSHRRKPNGQIHKSKYIKKDKDGRAKRVLSDVTYDEDVFIDKNNNDQNSPALHKRDKGVLAKSNIPITTTKVFATGLLIGHSEEQDTLQKKKEQYKRELLIQMAEQRENKRKEKVLELQVSATGVTVPHRSDTFRQFGSEYPTYEKQRHGAFSKTETGSIVPKDNPERKHVQDSLLRMEHREPRPNIAFPFPTPNNQTLPVTDTTVDEYNKHFSHMIGDVTTNMVFSVPPPFPPRVEQTYRTRHDEVYDYYGSRHPLEPIISYNQSSTPYQSRGKQENTQSTLPQQRHQQPSQPDCGQRNTVVPLHDPSCESDRQRRESYQEALKQQVKDKAERRSREREERQLSNSQIVSEMMSYNPWGRAGGGAPLRDQTGNLITDRDQMHKLNEESFRNSNLKKSSESTPQDKRVPLLSRQEQLGYRERDNLQRKISYQESLKQQIEENRQKQAEERERQKVMEEKEEKRLAEERARMLKDYEEEEQRNRTKMHGRSIAYKPDVGKTEDSTPAKERPHDHGEHQLKWKGYNEPKQEQWNESTKQIEEKNKKQEEERKRWETAERGLSERFQENKQKDKLNEESKILGSSGPSPTIPTVYDSNTNVRSPASETSQLSFKNMEDLETAPEKHSELTLERTQQLPGDQQEVITELGALRRILETKKKNLESKLKQTEAVHKHFPPLSRHQRQGREDSAAHRENVQLTTERLRSSQENTQNLREFHGRRYRDTSSREKLLHNHPEPPTDEPSLDRAQQQHRRELMNGRERHYDILDELADLRSNRIPTHESVEPLPAAKVEHDIYDCEEDLSRHYFVESQQRPAHRRRRDEKAAPVNPIKHFDPGSPPRSSDTIVKQKQSCRRQLPSELQWEDEEDLLSRRSSHSAPETPLSVATELWLRTTSEPEPRRPGPRPWTLL